jgi:erythromycin esterase
MNKLITKILLFILVAVVLFSCVPEKSSPTQSDKSDPQVNPESKNWIVDNAHELYSADDVGMYYDLMPLISLIGNSRIVALGEATYGTHECSRMKLRILDFLVNEMDFNVVLFGSDYPESARISDFINSGNGDVREILYSLLWWRTQIKDNNLFWISQEVADMINWIYKYNQFIDDEYKVKFYGYGVQRPQKAMANVIDYFEMVDTSAVEFIMSKYNRFQLFNWRYPVVGTYIMNDCREGVIAVRDTLEKLRSVYAPLTSNEDYEKALFLSNFVVRSEQVLRRNQEDLENTYKYDMIKYIINNSEPNDKFVIWGQNSELGNYPNKLGGLLKNDYDQEIRSIGFSIYSGYFFGSLLNPKDDSYSWPCLFDVPVPPQDSFEELLHSAEIPYFILDINSNLEPQGSPATDWLYSSKYFNSIEMFYEPDKPGKYFNKIYLRDIYNLIVHIDKTSKSELFIY